MQRLRVRFQSRRWTELITKRCSVFMCLSLLVALSNPTNTGGRRWPSSCFESNRRHCHRSLYVDVHSYKLQKPSESSVHHDKWTDSYIVLYTHSPYFKCFLSKCIRGETSGLVSRPRMFGLQTGGARVRTIEPALPPDLQPLVNEGSQESCFLLQTFSQWTKTNWDAQPRSH